MSGRRRKSSVDDVACLSSSAKKSKVDSVVLTLAVPIENYSFAESVCSYGYFTLPPNVWRPAPADRPKDEGRLIRPVRFGVLSEHAAVVQVAMSSSLSTKRRVVIEITVLESSAPWRQDATTAIVAQVKRMLRPELDLTAFHEKHPEAKKRGWGRTYRGPTLFEDMVKTVTNCNMQWQGTVAMNTKLCCDLGTPLNAFPTPHELAAHSPEHLRATCRLGYRAAYVHDLAVAVSQGRLDLDALEHLPTPEELTAKVRTLKGFGPFAANNLLHLCGHFEAFPYDTETVRLWREEKGGCRDKKDAERKAKTHYQYLAPYQWQGYWFDLWRNYEKRNGSEATRWSDFDKVATQFSGKKPPTASHT